MHKKVFKFHKGCCPGIYLVILVIGIFAFTHPAMSQESTASLSNIQNMGNEVWFDVVVKNTSNHKSTVYVVVYAKNDFVSPPRRSAWPTPGLLFSEAGTRRGQLSPLDISKNWNSRSKFSKGTEFTLLPGKSETIPAALPLNRYLQLPAWRGKRFKAGSMYNEWHIWVFSETGKLIYKRKHEK